jgi:hypothetical protein
LSRIGLVTSEAPNQTSEAEEQTPLAATDTSRMCQWLPKTIQHGLRFHVGGASGGASWVGRASTGDHQHSWEVPMACT